ncbi:hypothetical protein NUW54_g8778 [Trametes sanguinea]|uniref:Uncharacterized protein n=1 Tax=Trametes sanguinea TaxID=158606 RepID=A0ACC1PAY4_9APHY|nr:hypothetical protein NUW54_g8778 [Trametes sanguinea]
MVAPLSQLPILDPSIRTTPLAGPSDPIPFSLPPSDYIPPGVFVTSPSPPATPTHCESPAPPYSPPSVRDIADRLQNVYITPHTVYPTVITGVVAAASSGPFSPDWNDGVPWLAPENTQCSTWYVVTVGRRVGVFDNSEETIAATSGVPRNISRGGFTSRDDAINAFQRQLASGTSDHLVMGRSAKYRTLAERQRAHHKAVLKYDQTSSGKAIRSQRNKRDYEARKQRTYMLLGTTVPAAMFRHAQQPRPASFSFTSDSTELLLGLWSPPYVPTRPGDDALGPVRHRAVGRWDSFNAHLCAVLYDEILRRCRERRALWEDPLLDLESTKQEIKQEIQARCRAWESALNSVCEGEEDIVIRDIYLDWGARIPIMMAKEWEQRKEGIEVYMRLKRDGELPWQRMVKDMLATLAQTV